MTRAIKERDQHCQFPGCTHTQHLQIHHINHWADGGTTCVTNGVCVCQSHHTLLHEGGYAIQRIDSSEQRLNEQFAQQQHANDMTLFDFEKGLRNDRESFNQVRKLSPTCYRFRIVDATEQDIRHQQSADTDTCDIHYSVTPAHSTRVECREPQPEVYSSGIYAQPKGQSHNNLRISGVESTVQQGARSANGQPFNRRATRVQRGCNAAGRD